jgi:uncharacterized protein (TIGR02611 family)
MATEHAEGRPPAPDADDPPELLVKLQERKARHKQKHPIHRVAVVMLGIFLILAGIVLSGPGVPGPGFLVILIGLAFVALEFDRAERLLERAIVWGDQLGDWAQRRTTGQKIAFGLVAAAAVAGFVVAAIRWDIPLLPLV